MLFETTFRLIAFGAAILIQTGYVHAHGFEGTFEFRWTEDPQQRHRIMELLSPVAFIDERGKRWAVPAGAKIDGASIPPVLWTFSGSPFVGNYRRASVIHDFFCEAKTDFTKDVHNMFRDAMKFDGIPESELFLKHSAVSVYSLLGGECGKKQGILDIFLYSDPFNSITASDELFAEFKAFDDGTGGMPSLDSRIDTVQSLAQVENTETFSALVEFRRVPSAHNLEVLDQAIRLEQPSELELDELILLAVATVPEGSMSLPVK